MLIIFRKLREGVFSSRRRDNFALEVYETSLYLAVAFDSLKQAFSIIPHLLPDLYLTSSSPSDANCILSVLISLLCHLVSEYPSQKSYRQLLQTLPPTIVHKDDPSLKWITSVAKCMRVQNYVVFWKLTRRTSLCSSISNLSEELSDILGRPRISAKNISSALAGQSLLRLIDVLSLKFRSSTWTIIRSAYREFSCCVSTQSWLQRSLILQPLTSYGEDMTGEEWFEAQRSFGHIRLKEGVEGKWILCKAR